MAAFVLGLTGYKVPKIENRIIVLLYSLLERSLACNDFGLRSYSEKVGLELTYSYIIVPYEN